MNRQQSTKNTHLYNQNHLKRINNLVLMRMGGILPEKEDMEKAYQKSGSDYSKKEECGKLIPESENLFHVGGRPVL